MAPPEVKNSPIPDSLSLDSTFGSLIDRVSFRGQERVRRQQRYDDTAKFLDTLSSERIQELSKDLIPRIGLAAKSIKTVQAEIDSLGKFLSEKKLAGEYPGTLENLELCKQVLKQQFSELVKSGVDASSLLNNNSKAAILASEPAFNKRTGNTIGGIIDDSQQILTDIGLLRSLIEKQNKSVLESYRLFIKPLDIRSDARSVVRDDPQDFATQASVRDKSKVPMYVEQALAPGSLEAGAKVGQVLELGLKAAVTFNLLNPKWSDRLNRLIGNSDNEFVALPKQSALDAKQRADGEKAYKELVLGEKFLPHAPLDKGYISEVKPKGFFERPGEVAADKLIASANSSKAQAPVNGVTIVASSGTGDPAIQEQFSAVADRIVILIKEKDFGKGGRKEWERTVRQSIGGLLKLAETGHFLNKDQLDGISIFIANQLPTPENERRALLKTTLNEYRHQGLRPSSELVTEIFSLEVKQSNNLRGDRSRNIQFDKNKNLQIETIVELSNRPEYFAEVVGKQVKIIKSAFSKLTTKEERDTLDLAEKKVNYHNDNKLAPVESNLEKRRVRRSDVRPEEEPPMLGIPLNSAQAIVNYIQNFNDKTTNEQMRTIEQYIAEDMSEKKYDFYSRQALTILQVFAERGFLPIKIAVDLVNALKIDSNSLNTEESFAAAEALLALKIGDSRVVQKVRTLVLKNLDVQGRRREKLISGLMYLVEYSGGLSEIIDDQKILTLARASSFSSATRFAEVLASKRPEVAKQIVGEIIQKDPSEVRGAFSSNSALIRLRHLTEYLDLPVNSKPWVDLMNQSIENRRLRPNGYPPSTIQLIETQLINTFGESNVEREAMLEGLGYKVDFGVNYLGQTVIVEMDGKMYHDLNEIVDGKLVKRLEPDSYTVIREKLLKKQGTVVHVPWDEFNKHYEDEGWLAYKIREAIRPH